MLIPFKNKDRAAMKFLSFVFLCLLLVVGCGKKDGRTTITFWHTQRGVNQEALDKIINDFNQSQTKYRVVPQYLAGYNQIYRKMIVNIRANKPPALAVAYQSMVARYYEAGAVVDLDEYLNHPEYGLSAESQADIYPLFITANRFKHYDNKLLSFPFTKSILMMYYNKGVLREVGYDAPPKTWDEFVGMCRAVKKKGGKQRGYALSIDASTIDAMVYSFSGDVINSSGTQTLFDGEEARGVFGLLKMMIDEGLAYPILKGTNDDKIDLANDRAAFVIRSSTTRAALDTQVEELKTAGRHHAEWGLTIIPHADGRKPVTVMFGANICMLKTTPEVQRGAWEFIKYFTSTAVTADWASKSSYLPVRRSAVETAVLKQFFKEKPRALEPLNALQHAVQEPTVDGWQEIRNYIEDAELAVVMGKQSVDQALATLNEKSNRLLEKNRAADEE